MLLQEYTDAFSTMIQQFQLTDEQLAYTGRPEMPIKISKANSFIHPILGIEDELLTNFFVLDEKKDVALYTTNQQAVLLRTFSTDYRYQGKGYAKQVLQALPYFIQTHFPNCNEIILAVNQENIAAQKLYETTGFKQTEKIVQGEYGPLYVMTMSIETTEN
ncbi:GNAT family N-acetyltransferase [Enterococcus sp. 5H]|uniref:GNAT family N-acetyltransferase n=1 Tax=Enterococcus sp. 5H TaxID=1229490 RepID=UPI002303806A|nr:GNAT family N-acetyltransferase [Enterococcus sp. 5H]MDA9472307.1 acetyltransferase [Enterococcus sp. 5H]